MAHLRRAEIFALPLRPLCSFAAILTGFRTKAFLAHPLNATFPAMAFRVISPRRIYQEIALQIRTHIENGEFPSGSRLPSERELAQQLKVSRPSVREALIALEVEGLVEVRTGSGVFVCKPQRAFPYHAPSEGPLEIMRARIAIEGETAAMAAPPRKSARSPAKSACCRARTVPRSSPAVWANMAPLSSSQAICR